MIRRMLSVIENEVLPKTEKGVAIGNKVFGAAVLDARVNGVSGGKTFLPTVIAETNHETVCPVYHGEVYTIKQWSETIPAEVRPAPSDSIFLSTHEPCCMCMSAIVWSGFKKVFYLFLYETTREQGIPHDISIMQEVWQVPRYAPRNKFCSSAGLIELIDVCEDDNRSEFHASLERITRKYDKLARQYHDEKTDNPNNNLAFN
jgi:tRNA(Arg) A34 adenosine deaminase TadA